MVDLSNGKKPATTNVDTGVEVVYPTTLDTFLTTSH
jgi:hypothetical protein